MTARSLRSAALAAATLVVSAASAVPAIASGSPEPDVHDIRGPIAIPYWWIRPVLFLAALAVVGLAVGAYRVLRKRIRSRAKTPAELAIERIERARALVGTGRAAEFSAELSDAVRDYVEARWRIRAAHKTTEEFLRDLVATEASPIARHREALDDFLSKCDLAKFARFALSAKQMEAMIMAARHFVETSEATQESEKRPSPAGPSGAAAAAEVPS